MRSTWRHRGTEFANVLVSPTPSPTPSPTAAPTSSPTSLPSAPASTELQSSQASCTSIDLSWKAVSGTSRYLVEMLGIAGTLIPSEAQDGIQGQQSLRWNPAYEGTSTSATVTGLQADTEYNHIRVRAYGNGTTYASRWGRTASFPNVTLGSKVSFSNSKYTVQEGGSAPITLGLSCSLRRNVNIPVVVTPGADASVAIANGASSGSFSCTAAQDSDCSNESVNLRLGTLPSRVSIGATRSATLTISDDDSNCGRPPPPSHTPPSVPLNMTPTPRFQGMVVDWGSSQLPGELLHHQV